MGALPPNPRDLLLVVQSNIDIKSARANARTSPRRASDPCPGAQVASQQSPILQTS